MIKNKAFEVIRTFNSDELKSFELFIASPFFNTNKTIIKFFVQIKKNISQIESDKTTEEYYYSRLFPGKKYNYGIMKNLVSDLFGLCEKFLAVNLPGNSSEADYKKVEFEEGLRKLDNYGKRSLEKLFFAEYRHLEKQIEYSVLSPGFYLNKSLLVEKLYKFYTRKSQYSEASKTFYPMSIYNTCYIISTLKHDVAGMEYLKSQLNFIPKANATEALYTNFDSENFLKQVSGLETVYYDHISLEIKLMKLYNEPDNWENYSMLKEFILKNLGNYSNPEKWHLTSALFGFVLNGYIANSNKELLMEIAFIRKVQLANVKFNAEGIGPLQAGIFRNIVEAFVILGETDSAEDFINKFTKELEEDKRKSVFSYSMALIEESKGNNEKVLGLIRDAEFTDYQAKFSAKMVALVAFYNLGSIEQGLSAVDSMKHFLKNTDEFSEGMKINLSERVTIMERLFKIKANPEKYSEFDVNELISDIQKSIVSRKEWHLQKAEELKELIS